jgi:hypothetical protein
LEATRWDGLLAGMGSVIKILAIVFRIPEF